MKQRKDSTEPEANPMPTLTQSFHPEVKVESKLRPNKRRRPSPCLKAEATLVPDDYIASLPIDEVEDQLRAPKSETGPPTFLDYLQQNTAKSYDTLLGLIERAQKVSVTAMLTWRYVQERRLWLEHPDAKMRSREAFIHALRDTTAFDTFMGIGASTYRWKKLSVSCNGSADPTVREQVGKLFTTDKLFTSTAQGRLSNTLAPQIQSVVACLVFSPNVPIETATGFFTHARAVRIVNPAAPKHMRALLQTQDSVLWGSVAAAPDVDRKLSSHYDSLLARGATHLDFCSPPIIVNEAE
ncbi:hypothetical protein MBLNU457_6079t1 [Dothideomycetes sp. NU457]